MPTRRTSFAVVLPEVGLASETFIRWDVERLLPSATAVVADPPPGGLSVRGDTTWSLGDQPALVFEPVGGDPYPSDERIAAVLAFLERHHVAVVLVEYLDFADRWFNALHRAGHRVWVRGHGIDLSARLREDRWVRAYQRLAGADGIIVPSRHACTTLAAIGLPEAKIHVVRYPVALPAHPHQHDTGTARCVAVGRLVAKKAPLLMLEAFHHARQANPRLTLDVVGDGLFWNDVHDFVSANGLCDHVQLHGRLAHDQSLSLLRRADILLHHAVTAPDGDTEGLPLAILEAMAAGLAVVATDHAGTPEIITDGRTGRLVAEHDVSGMAAAVVELAADHIVRARIGHAARQAITREHTEEHAAERLRHLLELETVAT